MVEPEVAVQVVEPSVAVLQVVVILLLQLFDDCHDLFSLLGDTVCVKMNEARRFFFSFFFGNNFWASASLSARVGTA